MGVEKTRQKILAAGGLDSLGPVGLASYTVAELTGDTPPAADNLGALVWCSDASTPIPCYSDGTIWRTVNGAIAPAA